MRHRGNRQQCQLPALYGAHPAPLSAEMWTELCRDAPQGSGCSRGEDESAIQDTAAV